MCSQTSLPTSGQLKLAVHGCVGFCFEYFQGQRLHKFSGNMCQCLVTLAVKQLILILKLNFLYVSVCAKSHQVGGFLTRDDYLDSVQSLAACDQVGTQIFCSVMGERPFPISL